MNVIDVGGLLRAGFVVPLGVVQGWVCCPAGCGTGLGLLSRCACDRAGSVIPLSGAGLGLLSRCQGRAGSVILLPRAGLGLLSRCCCV